jgi:uncharacterized membrane protein
MNRNLVAYGATALVFCALDFVWIGIVANTFYKSQIGSLLLAQPKLWPAVLFYILYVGGLVIFCVLPALDAAAWTKAAVLGGLLGLLAYATYDLSNFATLKNWTLPVTLVDIAWGCAASAMASTCGYFGAELANRTV